MSHSQERERGAREELRDAGQVPPLPATRLSEFRVLAWLWVVFFPPQMDSDALAAEVGGGGGGAPQGGSGAARGGGHAGRRAAEARG